VSGSRIRINPTRAKLMWTLDIGCISVVVFTKNCFHQESHGMALSCRFCHPDPLQDMYRVCYLAALSFGSVDNLAKEVLRIEGMRKIIPGYCVRCEKCYRYSMISYALACYIHGDEAEKNSMTHYARLCTSLRMVSHFPYHPPKRRRHGNDRATGSNDICSELVDTISDEEE
jgi:hypothetical protein